MRLHKEIFTGEIGEAFGGARCLVFPLGEGYFEGVKGLGDFSPTAVLLRFSTFCVRIEGENLAIEKFLDGDLHLLGSIRALSVEAGK